MNLNGTQDSLHFHGQRAMRAHAEVEAEDLGYHGWCLFLCLASTNDSYNHRIGSSSLGFVLTTFIRSVMLRPITACEYPSRLIGCRAIFVDMLSPVSG